MVNELKRQIKNLEAEKNVLKQENKELKRKEQEIKIKKPSSNSRYTQQVLGMNYQLPRRGEVHRRLGNNDLLEEASNKKE